MADTQFKLSNGLKDRLAAFHNTPRDDPYWWHDPQYLVLVAEIDQERTDAGI
jgi:hypothetical protein